MEGTLAWPECPVVYLLGDELGNYKIGHTEKFKQRAQNYKTHSVVNFWLEHYIPCPDKTERLRLEALLHTRFSGKRVEGRKEFFRLSAEDIRWIKKTWPRREPVQELATNLRLPFPEENSVTSNPLLMSLRTRSPRAGFE